MGMIEEYSLIIQHKMDRDIPNYNPLINNKIQQKNMKLHYQRLNNIKSSQYSRVALSSNHQANRKSNLKQEERKTQIQRDNVTLFNKMVRIMKRSDPCNKSNMPHNRIHNRQSVQFSKIEEANRTMYERLEKQKPTIDNRKFQKDRKKNENILKFLGKYSAHSLQNMQPGSLRASQASRVNQSRTQVQAIRSNHYLQPTQMNGPMQLHKKARYNPYDQQELDDDQIKMHIQIANRGRKAYSSAFSSTDHKLEHYTQSIPPVQPVAKAERRPPLSAKDIILFKGKKEIQGELFDVSIVRSHNCYQIRAKQASGFEHQFMNIILDEQEGNELLQTTSYNYKAIINRLNIRNGQLKMGSYQTQQQIEESQQQMVSQPIHHDSYQPYSKQTSHQYNVSHITQQNDEESYRPNESVNHDFSPQKIPKRVDSLGPEQEEGNIQEHPDEGESYRQENSEDLEQERRQEQFQRNKLERPEQLARNNSEDNRQLQDFYLSAPAPEQAHPVPTQPPKEIYNFPYEQSLQLSATKAGITPGVASYEQALQEQIL